MKNSYSIKKNRPITLLVTGISISIFLACSPSSDASNPGAGTQTTANLTTSAGESESDSPNSNNESSESDSAFSPDHEDRETRPPDPEESKDANSDDSPDDSAGVRFDVPQSGSPNDEKYCGGKEKGVYCEGNDLSYECNENERVSNIRECQHGSCEAGIGCILCHKGQFRCLGNQILECDVSGDEAIWEKIDDCDVATEVCDTKSGRCIEPEVIGGTEPTGVYYKFMSVPFDIDAFNADTYEDLLYVTSGGNIHVYQLDLLDSDGDGKAEPNQHPDNPDAPGPIEERTVEFVKEISLAGSPVPIEMTSEVGWMENEIFAQDDRLFYLGGTYDKPDSKVIVEYTFATDSFKIISPPAGRFGSHLGYDEINDLWYASSEWNGRQVYQFDPVSNTWGMAFKFPALAGVHMDGMEVVPSATIDSEGRRTYGKTYVYVSDMTSDFIGQYRYDPHEGWVQENLFQYHDDTGVYVEGMGFGYLNHFWVAAYGELYELGGGDLAKYTEPVQ